MAKYLSDRVYIGFALIFVGVGLFLTSLWIGENGPGWTDRLDFLTDQGWYLGHVITAIAIAIVIGAVAVIALVTGFGILLSWYKRD
jgi:hypothetical protein